MKLIINLLTTGSIDNDDTYCPEFFTKVSVELNWNTYDDCWNYKIPEGLTGDQERVIVALIDEWVEKDEQRNDNDDRYHELKEDAV